MMCLGYDGGVSGGAAGRPAPSSVLSSLLPECRPAGPRPFYALLRRPAGPASLRAGARGR